MLHKMPLSSSDSLYVRRVYVNWSSHLPSVRLPCHTRSMGTGIVIYGPARNVEGFFNNARIRSDAVIYPASSSRHRLTFGPR